MSESPLEVMDVLPVYASALLAGAPVVSVASAVVSMSSLSSLELDGSPVTQHNKADAAIWNSYRNAYTSHTQTHLIIENQSNIVVKNTDPPPPLLKLGPPTAQTTDGVRWCPTGGGVAELPPSALRQSSMTERTLTSPGWPGGLELLVRPLSSLESPEARTVTTWDPVPPQVRGEGGSSSSTPGLEGATSMPGPPIASGPGMGPWSQSPHNSSSVGEWQSDDDQPQVAAAKERWQTSTAERTLTSQGLQSGLGLIS